MTNEPEPATPGASGEPSAEAARGVMKEFFYPDFAHGPDVGHAGMPPRREEEIHFRNADNGTGKRRSRPRRR